MQSNPLNAQRYMQWTFLGAIYSPKLGTTFYYKWQYTITQISEFSVVPIGGYHTSGMATEKSRP